MLLFVLTTVIILFSGCVGENNATQLNESAYQGSVNGAPENIPPTNLSSEEENIPEIKVTSFSSIYMHDNTERVYKYLFSWDNVPGNESQNLMSHLKNDLGIDWADNAQVVKTNANETILVFTSENSLELTLEDNKSEILTTIGSDSYHDSKKIKKENGNICVYNLELKPGYNITEKCYAVYNLSIKNNGSSNLDFKLSELHVRDGNHIFNTTIIEPEKYSSINEVLSDLETETKIEDLTLFPGQTINGYVIFQVNSLYNESFLLMYQEIPVTSPSFEKSIEALRITESFDYSGAFGIPPYTDKTTWILQKGSFEPNLDFYPYIWANWVNRSVFEFFNKTDSERILNFPPENIPRTHIVYAMEVIPERNITVLPVKTRFLKNNLLIFDDTGEELINTSRIEGIAVLGNKSTYEFHPRWNVDIPQTNVSDATIVRFLLESEYGRPLDSRMSDINQDVILDEELNITVARYYCGNFMS